MSAASSTGEVDLFIIGGGINGAGLARDAAGRGLSVVLAEQDDLASGTSSASSKLVHGGLRYLEHYEFRLVREALAEREALMAIAPHLVRPLRFVLPHQPAMRPAWMIRAGLVLYDHLGGRRSLPGSHGVDFAKSMAGAGLKPEFRRGFIYSDCRVDDARLVVANARDAAARGAEILLRTRCLAVRREAGAWHVTLRGAAGQRELRARAVANTAGPWAGSVAESVAGIRPRGRLRLVKGSHIVVPRLYQGEHAYILQSADGRVVFVIPFEERFSLIGTTEIAFAGPLGRVDITAEETRYLQGVVGAFLDRSFEDDEIIWTYAGVRPLYDDGKSDASAVTRDYVFELDGKPGEAPLISAFGGKLTTYRRLAEHALDKLRPWFPGLKSRWTGKAPLPGGALGTDRLHFFPALMARWPQMPPELMRRLARRHGGEVADVLGDARSPADLGRHFGGGLYEREILHFRSAEWAATAEDMLWRRTKEGLHVGAEGAAALRAYLGEAGPAPRLASPATTPQ